MKVLVEHDLDPDLSIDVGISTIENVVRRTLSHRNVSSATVSVVISGHEFVRKLNKQYLNHDYNTDVLSFTLSDSDEPLEGEVYVDAEMALERASEFAATHEKELLRYIVHGVLHLTGMDDATPEQRSEMAIAEEVVLAATVT